VILRRHIGGDVCQFPEVAALIDTFGDDLLMGALDLDDNSFSSIYGASGWNLDKRRAIKSLIETHLESCHYCQAVAQKQRSADYALDVALANNKGDVAEIVALYRRDQATTVKQVALLGIVACLKKRASYIAGALRKGRHNRVLAFAMLMIVFGVFSYRLLFMSTPLTVGLNDNPPHHVGAKDAEDPSKSTPGTIIDTKDVRDEEKAAGTKTANSLSRGMSRYVIRGAQSSSLPVIDLDRLVEIRGGTSETQIEGKSIRLCTVRQSITTIVFRLPERSLRGEYDIAVLDGVTEKPIIEQQAKSPDGVHLQVSFDMNRLPDGQHYLKISQDDDAPRFYPLTIKHKCS
jgi:hypothetical protein